ncbi:MAG: NAD-dependent epimerase/dehydratase family protein [Patescibacteria group bacterium]
MSRERHIIDMGKFLVTGGAGFIGTSLVKELLSQGHEVVVLDNYSGGKKEERIQAGAAYVKGDIRKPEDLNKVCEKGFDGIFHLAALPRVSFSVEHPATTHETNVTGTLNVLIAARDHKIKRVIFSSSSSIYGNQEVYPVKEDFSPSPISPYALHKYIGERYCRLFSDLYGIETACLRYFNVYGPYFDPEGAYALVIGKFLKQKKEGRPMTVCGDGEYFRDYTYVSDIAAANILAMNSQKLGKGEVFNIGNGIPHSVNELVEMIGGDSVFVPERPGDVRFTQADYLKAKEFLNWEPKINLEEGLKLTKEFYGV